MKKLIIAFLVLVGVFIGTYTSQMLLADNQVNNEKAAAKYTEKFNEKLKLHFLDVGQADSILVELPNHKTMLIDAGNAADGDTVVEYIKKENISRIDYLVATHPHEDHIGGMADVVSTFDIGSVFMSDTISTTKTFENLLSAIENKKLKITATEAGKIVIDDNNLSVKFIAPVTKIDDLNNMSLVINITYGQNTILLMGDAEKESENLILSSGQAVKADVLKIGHHGSDTSSSTSFLEAVSPKYAVISVGKGNDYGHPANRL